MASPSHSQYRDVVVLGAGVIGLATALSLQERGGYRVTIIAEILPSDPKSIKYTSQWAGAHHVSVAGVDPLQTRIDVETFNTMWELSAPGGKAEGCFMRVPQTEYYRTERNSPDALETMPNVNRYFLDMNKNSSETLQFRELPKESLVPEAVSGIAFDSVNTDSPVFLPYLLSRFLVAGGKIIRGWVQHIDQVIEGGAAAFEGQASSPSPPDAVIVCLGLGARTLGGVEDQSVYPIRGQTVLIRAPWVKFCMSMSGGPEKIWTYVIPRRNGDVIGGTYEANDWYPLPRPETRIDIIERVLAMCPQVAPPEIYAERKPTVKDILPLVIEDGCGFRPGRKGGVRLEVEWQEAPTSKKRIPVVHNYGHGGFGFLASFGSASVALELLEDALANFKVSKSS